MTRFPVADQAFNFSGAAVSPRLFVPATKRHAIASGTIGFRFSSLVSCHACIVASACLPWPVARRDTTLGSATPANWN